MTAILEAQSAEIGSKAWAARALQDAGRHREQGRQDLARRGYEAVLACDPQRPEALLALGAIQLAAGHPAGAEPLLRRCTRLQPDNSEALHAWGLALLLLNRPTDAYAALKDGYAADCSNALCAVHLADAAHCLQRDEDQCSIFEQHRAENPWGLGPLAGWAATLCHLGKRDDAIDVLEAACLLHPQATLPAAVRADLLARTTRQIEAEIALRRSLALDAQNHDASMALSVVLMRLHRYAESLAVLRSLLASHVDPVGPLCNMATVLVALGRQDERWHRHVRQLPWRPSILHRAGPCATRCPITRLSVAQLCCRLEGTVPHGSQGQVPSPLQTMSRPLANCVSA